LNSGDFYRLRLESQSDLKTEEQRNKIKPLKKKKERKSLDHPKSKRSLKMKMKTENITKFSPLIWEPSQANLQGAEFCDCE
jgi:hypothetical protein